MKFLKGILLIITLFTTDSTFPAKSTATAVTKTTQPVKKSTVSTTKPITQPPIKSTINQPIANSYAEALSIIKTKMLSNTVLKDNIFTQEFLNFIRSLNLSDIENKALLQAGTNIHAVWTGDNAKDKALVLTLKNNIESTLQNLKSMPQIQSTLIKTPAKPTQQLTTPTKAHCKANSVIMLLDPIKAETVERAMIHGSEAMVARAIHALQEKTAPIIMTSNILEIIATITQQIGDNDLQRLRKLIETKTDWQAMLKLEDQLNKSHNMHESIYRLSFLSLINFNNNNFNCYLHKSANLVLVIPKQYIQTNLPEATNLNSYDQAQACGFSPDFISTIDDLSVDSLLEKLHSQQSTTTFITSLISLFIPQKKNGLLIFPEQDAKWAIYIAGHGGPAQLMQNTSTNSPIVIPKTAYIAGLTLDEFSQLIKFFNNDINIAFLHYSTCFGGGYNQIFVNEILSSLNVNFIVSSEGIHEGVTNALLPHLIPNESKTRLIPSALPYTEFFRLLRLFICQPQEFVKIKGEKKEPIAQILKTIVPNMLQENQPFVRFPGADVFGALSINKKTKKLTQSIVKAHEIENKPINMSNTDIDLIIVNPSRINIPLNLGKNAQCAIVSPTSATITPSYEVIHVFKEINFENTLQLLLYNFIYLNAHLDTRIFIVKTLTGILFKQSGLPIQSGKTNIIHNLIIQIKGIPNGLNMGAKIEVSFELNGNIYECMINIEDFKDPKLQDNIKKVTFISQPTINMNSLANKFLTSQEVTALTKPITLDIIAQFIESKIDQLESSILQQSNTNNEALLEFAKKRTNK